MIGLIDRFFCISDEGIFDNQGIVPDWDTLLLIQSKIEEVFSEFNRESLTLAIEQIEEEQDQERKQRRIAAAARQKSEPKIYKAGFVYLMHDTALNYRKIGFSVKPSHREKTLQAEKPTIQLEHYWPGTWKTEQALHEKFKDKHVRGEWFDLKPSDIAEIKAMFEKEESNVS